MLLLILSGLTLCNYTVSSQSKKDVDAEQQEMDKEQQEMAKEQQEMAKEQQEMAKEQQEIMNALKREMLMDDLLKSDENYELIINRKEMLINGIKQSEVTHKKYIKLINSKRKKSFDEKEEWRWNIKE